MTMSNGVKKYTLRSTQGPKDLKIDYKKELNAEQYKVVTEADGPCLVLAGAGSGKTRTLVYRLAYLLESGVNPNRIMLVTFTNRAAKEMLNRTEVLYKEKPKGLWGGTFHGIGNRILRIYGKHIGVDPEFTILDSEDAATLTKSCLSDVFLPQDKYFPKAKIIHKMISLATNLAQPLEDVLSERFSHIDKDYIPFIVQIAKKYEQKKKQANSLDFDDLLSQWNRLLLEKPEIKDILAMKFKYVLVDEYQDTNHIQGEIINHLAGKDQNILVVGDDSQSIYSFRGADVNNILSFPDVFSGSKTYRLETNYRSTPQILDLANQSIKNNENKFEKTLVTNKPSGDKPAVVPLENNGQQAEFICQRILDLQGGLDAFSATGSDAFSRKKRGLTPSVASVGPDPFSVGSLSEMAILFRAHYQSLELEMEMNKRNIPYEMRGGQRFFEQAHIKDVVAYMKIINNAHDELSWHRVLQLESGIGAANANKIWQVIAKLSYLSEAFDYPFAEVVGAKPFSGWKRVESLLKDLTKVKSYEVGELIEKILKSGYGEYVKNNFENFEDRLADLEQLVVFASSYEALSKLLADIALSEGFRGSSAEESRGLTPFSDKKKGPDPLNSKEEAVTLSTIHQAKGLEWKVVFVIGLVDGQFPGIQVVEKPEQMEEERRLFYVATTRAQDQLYLTYPLFSSRMGQLTRISQFISELPSSVHEEWRVDEESPFSSPSLPGRGLGGGLGDFDDDENVIKLDEDGEVISSNTSDVAKEFWQRVIKSRK